MGIGPERSLVLAEGTACIPELDLPECTANRDTDRPEATANASMKKLQLS